MGIKYFSWAFRAVMMVLFFSLSISPAWAEPATPKGPPPVPVVVAKVLQESVAEQITLVGTTEAVVRSTIAAEVPGLVEYFPVKEGDFVKKGQVLVTLKSTALKLRLKAAEATRRKVEANLTFAEKELERHEALRGSDSIAARKYDEVVFEHTSLQQELLRTEAEIELLKDDINNKKIVAPFSGFVAREHTQLGEWLPVGGAVVTLVDLSNMRVTVDAPERYVVQLAPGSPAKVLVTSFPDRPFQGNISAVLPEGDPDARTFPVRVILANEGSRIKSGMEARITFDLSSMKNALLLPKDAVVAQGANRLVFVLSNNIAQPIPVEVIGYYDGNVAINGPIQAGTQVVIRGNERLRPGQAVTILENP